MSLTGEDALSVKARRAQPVLKYPQSPIPQGVPVLHRESRDAVSLCKYWEKPHSTITFRPSTMYMPATRPATVVSPVRNLNVRTRRPSEAYTMAVQGEGA